MSALNSNRDRRGAQRLALPKPVPATLGGFAGTIIEFSLIGCGIKHVDRVPPRARLALRFSWRGAPVQISATVVRSEMQSAGGKTAYLSGLEFCTSIEESPPLIRDIVGWLVEAAAKKSAAAGEQTVTAPAASVPAEQVPFLRLENEDEPELVSAPYLQCTFGGGQWMKLYVEEPEQPGDGFTIPTPSDDAEVDVLCRAYEAAGAEARRTMRASFELAIARNRR